MQFLKIVVSCIFAAILYGTVHDQITARICLEYFTVFHPPVFGTQSPTLLGMGWGILATWWVGATLGLLLAFAAQAGPRTKTRASTLAPRIGKLLFVMAVCASTAGVLGYFVAPLPDVFRGVMPESLNHRFLADWWAHMASYGSGCLGGLILCWMTWRERKIPEQRVLHRT